MVSSCVSVCSRPSSALNALAVRQVWGFPDYAISMVCSTLLCCVTSWIITSQFLAPLTQAPSTLLQCYMIDEEYFAHDAPSRFAEKEMHTWVDTYGGEHASYTDVLLG